MPEYEVSVMISNSRERTITFVLEPWGAFYSMEPHATFMLVLRGSIQGTIEVEDGLDSITVYAWTGCTDAVLSHNGKELYSY